MMDEGKTYRVVYNDGQRDRVKTLVFKDNQSPFLLFINPRNNKEEIINEAKIIRMEEVEDGSGKD